MNHVRVHPSRALFISVLMIAMFATAAAAQKMPAPTLWEDTAINPHDFTDEYYASNGILGKAIIGRRTGSDLLSVLSPSSNPDHTRVRVIATFAAYGPSQEMLFWYPLGQLNDNGFTEDRMGMIAREIALGTPLYVFPVKSEPYDNFNSFANMRQSALFGPTVSYYVEPPAIKLIARRIVEVRYTDKAFNDKDCVEMMDYMRVKNGEGVDGLPIIRSMDDLYTLAKLEMISTGSTALWDDNPVFGMFAITPTIDDPTGGVIAPDAFLIMPSLNGKPLPTEQIFATEFGCLQKYRFWCGK